MDSRSGAQHRPKVTTDARRGHGSHFYEERRTASATSSARLARPNLVKTCDRWFFTVPGDTLGPSLRGPAELHLADQAGNEKVIPLSL